VERAVSDPLAAIAGGLVVSVQAPPGSPLRDPSHMAAMARAAELGGAAGIRAAGDDDVSAIRAAVSLPLIGLRKRPLDGSPVLITPEASDARAVAAAGADVVAVDATARPRPGAASGAELVAALDGLGVPVLADVDTLEAGVAAREAGAAAVASTLSGYTGGPTPPDPDIELVRALARELDCPVVAEGRIATPEQVRAAFDAGAHAVVVGTAITEPIALTRRLAGAAGGEGADGDAR
jgi:N-acylglucosamine-6-phosphate 2-epimerase